LRTPVFYNFHKTRTGALGDRKTSAKAAKYTILSQICLSLTYELVPEKSID